MTEDERTGFIFDVLSTVSNINDLMDMTTSSPQYLAFQWIDSVDNAIICPPRFGNDSSNIAKRLIQRYVVSVFYFATYGPTSWLNCRDETSGGDCVGRPPNPDNGNDNCLPPSDENPMRYLDGSHECNWLGSHCSETCAVADPSNLNVDEYYSLTRIQIASNGLSGFLPFELFDQLIRLQLLTLDGNENIGGTIPTQIGSLKELRSLDLDDNSLVGPLPTQMYSLTNLQALDLNDNNLSGTLSVNVGLLENLILLQLQNNNFRGPVPTDGLANIGRLGEF